MACLTAWPLGMMQARPDHRRIQPALQLQLHGRLRRLQRHVVVHPPQYPLSTPHDSIQNHSKFREISPPLPHRHGRRGRRPVRQHDQSTSRERHVRADADHPLGRCAYPFPSSSFGPLCLVMFWNNRSLAAPVVLIFYCWGAVGFFPSSWVGECCADNGGPASIYASSHCANNWPLRGGKKTNFEGGIRTAAFVSGGFLPAAARGQLRDQYIHCADWYRTLCHLSGGVDCGDIVSSRKHDVPPVDGHDVWDYVIGANATSPRVEIMVSRCEV